MGKEIRATGLSETVCDRWKEISELLGGTTNSANMTTVVNLLYLLYCSSRWSDIQRKAAMLVTAQWADRGKEVVPMHPSEVKRVSMDASKTLVYTHSQGEPYLIMKEVWEKG